MRALNRVRRILVWTASLHVYFWALQPQSSAEVTNAGVGSLNGVRCGEFLGQAISKSDYAM